MSTPDPTGGEAIVQAVLSQAVKKPRIAMNMNISHQCPGEDPVSYPFTGISMNFETAERPYSRTKTIVEGNPLVLEWGYFESLSNIGMVLLQNTVGKGRSTQPSPEEREAEVRAVLYVEEMGLLIPPRFSFCFIPDTARHSQLTVKCMAGEAKLLWVGIGK